MYARGSQSDPARKMAAPAVCEAYELTVVAQA
jgi:hypothetical protein